MFLTPSKLLKIVFGLGLFVILCIGGFTYKHINSLSESTEVVKDTYNLRSELEYIISNLKDAELGHRGYLLTHDSIFLEPYEESAEKIKNNLSRLDTLIIKNKIQRQNLNQLELDIAKRFVIFNKSLDIAEDKIILSQELLLLLHDGKIKMDRIRNDISVMLVYENKLLVENQKKSEQALGLTPLFLYGILVLTLVLLLIAYAKINRDLTVLSETNEDLEIFKKLTEQAEVVSKSGTWIWYVDENTYHFSDNLYKLLGVEPNSFEPSLENLFGFIHEDDREGLGQEVNSMIKNEELPFVNYRIVQPDGTIKHFKAHAQLIDNGFEDKQLLGVTLDVTDEFDNFRLIEERNLELERNNKELSAFNYVASHDLQEPLRKIQTFISRIEAKELVNLSEKGQFYIEKIKSSSSRMRMLIEDLLQYSRTNNSKNDFKNVDINLLLEQAKQELLDSIEDKNAEIISSDLPTMEVVSFQIEQLFINLISNSLKYSREGVAPVIKIKHQEILSNDVEFLQKSLFKYHHKIIFKDNGIGFEQTYSKKIFDLFNRLHGKSEYSGTGIGLAICKKIVDNHQGVIIAEGNPGVGATFTIYLPFLK
ncbi:CHASE3 domain-containing protein [Winogradskyella undariae]|uniref:sensor histidine kinase n=1 Tax=Winogradskyella TaxID=286104 RepID=UPI00156BAB64|nr:MULTISPECIES: CHASE3 domain-containing protein [Winogradskyella]NRR92826.1 CHASE3 domain-containing protein [Winogradskyella undariae]QXP79862.1 CHASE3 domain-containing protein [Winogradskyella sp. HaHa_3_26]